MNVIFIVNEQAGGGRAAALWRKYKQQLTIDFIEHCTEYAGHAIKLARDYKERIAIDAHASYLLIAVGGDGTIHEVIEGAAGSERIIIGAIKAGSGNDFARGYSVFSSIAHLEQYVRERNYNGKAMDLGYLIYGDQKASFVNNTGVGFDAYVVYLTNTSTYKKVLNKLKLGKLGYLISTVLGLFRFKRFNATIYNEGSEQHFSKVWFIAVSNQPYFGGGMKISPRSNSSDGKLELTIVHQLSRIKLLTVFLTVFWGKHERFKEVTMLQGENFEIQLDSDAHTHVDGESLGLVKSKQRVRCGIGNKKWSFAVTD